MSFVKNIFKQIYLNFVKVIKFIYEISYKFIKIIFNLIVKLIILIYNIIAKIILTIINVIKTIVIEIYKILKYFVIGIYKSIMAFINFIIFIFTKIYKALVYVFVKIYKVLFIVFKFIGIELYVFFKFFVLGVYKIIKGIFYEIPRFFINALSSFFYLLYNKTKKALKAIKEFLKQLPKKIINFFVNKWNNSTFIKHYRNKRERKLEVLFIDKDSEDAVRASVKQTYYYVARNKEGKVIKGYFSALSKLDTHSYLLDEGYEVYQIKTSKWINFIHGESRSLKRKMVNKDLIFWLTQISTYIKSGIPLTEAIKILAKQDKRKKYKKVYDSIIYELTMGESFSKALEKQGNTFPGLLVNMIAAAELIGDIESTLDDMAIYYTEVEDTRKAMISAMTYPTIIFFFALAVIAFILIYIIPQFVDVYESAGVELNPMTQFVLDLSDSLKTNYFFIIITVIGVITVHRVLYKNLKAYKTFIQYLIMHIPVVGKVIIYKEINLFAKTFSALNKNNVLLTESIDILSKITNNEIYKMIMFDTISNLLRGDKMSDSFKNNWAVPELAYYMITTGESTGELATMLDKVSEFFQKQQRNIINVLKTFIEPLMIAFLAIVVGGILLSVIVPMFGLYSSIS